MKNKNNYLKKIKLFSFNIEHLNKLENLNNYKNINNLERLKL